MSINNCKLFANLFILVMHIDEKCIVHSSCNNEIFVYSPEIVELNNMLNVHHEKLIK